MKRKLLLWWAGWWLCATVLAQTNIAGYEWWYDTQFGARQRTFVAPSQTLEVNTSLSAAMLSPGVHTLNWRAWDTEGKYSSILSRHFYRMLIHVQTLSGIVGYEMWWNSNFAGRNVVSFAPGDTKSVDVLLQTDNLPTGTHALNVRFKSASGAYSSILTQLFYKMPTSTVPSRSIVGAEYWLDTAFSERIYTPVTPGVEVVELNEQINLTNLTSGVHMLHIRFKDNTGMWSAIVTRLFYKVPTTPSPSRQITHYEYWFDANYAARQQVSVPPSSIIQLDELLESTSLPEGVHSFNIRFGDNTGLKSVISTKLIYKMPHITPTSKTISAYRYWLDNDVTNAVYKKLSVPVSFIVISDSVDLTTISKGSYVFHMQVQDNERNWSTVVAASISKLLFPIAEFEANATVFCDTGQVHFVNKSIDTDMYVWNFGDGHTVSGIHATHNYTSPGFYTVSLLASDSASGQTRTKTVEQLVKIHATPKAIIAGETALQLCPDSSVVLSGPANARYLWSTGDTLQHLTVTAAGSYFLRVSNPSYPGCVSYSDTTAISLVSIAEASFDYELSDQTVTFRNTSGTATSYLWDFDDGNTSNLKNPIHVYPDSGGSYRVRLYAMGSCRQSVAERVINIPAASPLDPEPTIPGTTLPGVVKKDKIQSVSVYPNPAKDMVRIKATLSKPGILNVTLLDMHGNVVWNQILVSERAGDVFAELQTVVNPPGVYLVYIKAEQEVWHKKLVIQH